MLSLIRTGLVSTVIAAMLVACAIKTPQAQDRAAQIDAYLNDLVQAKEFSGSVLVAREGKILINKGYGLADIENQVPNTSQTRFRIHWITMQFTAMAILMLQSEGQLDVQDPICQYIPDCPEYWRGITIHHLLTHTSGLSDWVQPWDSVTDKPSTSLQLVTQLQHKPPYFEPGEGFRYSNNGYIVLGHIIEKASGQSYETFLQQRIFEPLGMVNSGYADNNVAVGYKAIGIKAPVPDLLFRYSASGLYSSVEDLYLWDQALYGEQLIPQEYLDMMFTGYARTPSTDFKDSDYGYGWFIGQTLNRPVILHGGGMAGYTSMFLRFPDERVTIIVLRNYEIQIYDRLEIELAKMLFDNEMKK
jgi:CubicO group peptidase (beta-lactamase class C family)